MDSQNAIEEFPITLPDGTVFRGSLLRVPHRRTGRRIVVRDGCGKVLFYTYDCYDLGNATHSLDQWLQQHLEPRP